MPVFNSQLWLSFQLQNLIQPAYSPLSSPTSLTSCQLLPMIPLPYADQSFYHAFIPQLLSHHSTECTLFKLSTLPSTLCPPTLNPGCIPFLHTTSNELGAPGRLESACASTRTVSEASSHLKDSETDGHSKSWTDSPQEPLGHSEHTMPPNSKSPLSWGVFLLDFRCLFLNQDRRTPRLFSLRSSVIQEQLDFIQALPLSFFHSLHLTNVSLKREKVSLKHPQGYAIHWISPTNYFSNW